MTRYVLRALLSLIAGAFGVLSIAPSSASSGLPSLPILVYHEIRANGDEPRDGPTAISLARFESQMRYLHEHGYVTLSTDEVVNFVGGTGVSSRAKVVAIHFDDGWKSAQLALPALERYGFRAAFWIIPGTGIGWPHMDWDEVRAIAGNPRYDVLSHTMTHPWKEGETLPDLLKGRVPGKGLKEVVWELTESRRLLIEKLGKPVTALAWPSGLYNDTLISLARKAGYRALFTIDDGLNYPGGDLLRIPRTMIDGRCNDVVFAQILSDGRYRNCASGDDQTR